MANIVLVEPRGWQGNVENERAFPNIGIAFLVPGLRKAGHNVSIIDLNNEELKDNQFFSLISEHNPDIIGFSVKTFTMKNIRGLGQKIKDFLPNAHVIIGGPHTCFAWRELVAEPWIDIVFVGEGEEALPILCHRLMAGEPIEDVPGVVTKYGLKNGFFPSHPLIADLDQLPFPDYSLFLPNVRVFVRTHYPLVTSRGCVYKCTFCSVPVVSGHRFRKRSAENIIEELKYAKKQYEIMEFEVIDDLFNFDIERCKQICQAIIKADLKMRWTCPNGIRADRIDKEMAELMFKSGCHNVKIGIESAEPAVLASVKKGETIEAIESGILILKEAGINVGGFFIIGLPGDSLELQKRSIEFAKRMNIGGHFNMLVPFPGTELWDWAKANAHFLGDVEDAVPFADFSQKVKSIIETDDFSARERERAYEMAHVQLGQFDLVVPTKLWKTSHWRYHLSMLRLLWNYDKKRLLSYIFKNSAIKFRKIIRRLIQPGGRDYD